MLEITDNKLVYHYDAEEVWIEPWGPNALRVRATKENWMPEKNWALCRREKSDADISYTEQGAKIVNSKIRAEITKLGKIMFFHSDGHLLLEEYCRNRRNLPIDLIVIDFFHWTKTVKIMKKCWKKGI